MTPQQKMSLLEQIEQRRLLIVVGKLDTKQSAQDIERAWQDIWKWCETNALPCWQQGRSWTFLRDTTWGNIKRAWRSKIDSRATRNTGGSGGKQVRWAESDIKMEAIFGKGCAIIDGIPGVTGSLPRTPAAPSTSDEQSTPADEPSTWTSTLGRTYAARTPTSRPSSVSRKRRRSKMHFLTSGEEKENRSNEAQRQQKHMYRMKRMLKLDMQLLLLQKQCEKEGVSVPVVRGEQLFGDRDEHEESDGEGDDLS